VYSPNGIFLASCVENTVKIWRSFDGSLEKALRGDSIFSASFSPNGKLTASGDVMAAFGFGL
jgi:WD40 repeat protein